MKTLIYVGCIALAVLSIGNSTAALAQDAKATEVSWTWSASGKHNESDLAQCASITGSEQLELRFYKH